MMSSGCWSRIHAFGDPVITENDAARALMLIDQAGLNVHQRLIWEDLIQLWAKADDPDVSDWMDTQYATQAVLNATQDVIKRTQAAVTSTHMALEATQFVLTETAYQASFAQTLTAGGAGRDPAAYCIVRHRPTGRNLPICDRRQRQL